VAATTFATAMAISSFDEDTIDAGLGPVADPTRDRASATAYDPLDRVVYDLRRLGPGRFGVVGRDYDVLGRVAKTTRYARAVGPLADFSRATIAFAVAAAADVNDRRTLDVYDAAGRKRFELQTDTTPRWSVSENRYDAIGNVIESRRYDRQVTDAWVASADTADSPGVTEHEILDQLASLGYRDDTPGSLTKLQRTRFAYDTANQLRFTVDALGSVAENRYDTLGRVVSTVRFAARASLTDYTEPAISAAVDADDANNQVERRAYDATGQLRFTLRAIEPNVRGGARHRVSEQRYDAFGQVVDKRAYAMALGPVPAYDEAHIAGAIFPDPRNDRRSAIAYDAGGRQVYTIRELTADPADAFVVTQQLYDGLRQVLQRSEYATPVPLTQFDKASIDGAVAADPAADRTTAYLYDAGGRLHFEVHPDRSFQETVYDALGSLTETRQFDLPLPENDPRSEAELVALRGDHTVGDGTTRGQAHTYDAAGRLTSTRDALNNIEQYEYNPLGDRTGWIDKNRAGWTYAYDRKGQRTKQTSPPVQFKLSGEPLITTAPNRVLETRFGYDAFGNLIQQTEAANFPTEARTTDLRYDTVGRLTSTQFPGYYDPAIGRVEKEPGPDRFRRDATTLYDPLGNAVRSSVRTAASALQHTYRTFDRQARVVHEVNPLNHVTRYTYTSFDEPEVVTRYSVTISSAPANGLYWTAAEVDPQLIHDENGNQVPDPDARPITMAYDKLGRKMSVTQPTATFYNPGDPSQVNDYRPNASSVVGVQDAAVTRYEYDAFGDLTRQRVRINNIVEWQDTSYTYDAAGRQTRSVNAAGHITGTRYDALGNVVRTDEPSGFSNGSDRISRFAYNALNQQTHVDRYGLRYSDANGDHGIAYWTWEDGGHWVDPDADVATTVKTTTYDGYGRVLDVTDGVGNRTSTRYNALGQLISVTEPARLVAPVTANSEEAVDPFRDQVSETPVTSLTVNAFGRAVRMVIATSQSPDARETRQAYDAADELVSTTDPEGNVKLRSYDFAGRVISETQPINTDLGPLGTNTQGLERRYVYDGIGQLTDTLDVYTDAGDPMQSGRSVDYNAFGEVTVERRKWGLASQRPDELDSARVTSNLYDNAGHVIEKLAADGRTVYFYNLQGQVTREEKRGNNTDTDGTRTRVTETQYDVLGRATLTRKPAFEADVSVETDTTLRMVTPYTYRSYDRWGNVGTYEEGGYQFVNGQPVFAPSRLYRSYGYDDDNRQVFEGRGTHDYVTSTGTTQRAVTSTNLFRDLLGNVVREVDEAREVQSDELLSSRTRHKEYTSAGQLSAVIDATGQKVEYTYNIHGNRLGTRNAHGTVSFDRYDRNGSIRFSGVLRTTSPAGVGEYNSFTGTGTIIRTYLSAHQHDQANRRFASKTFTQAADAPWVYTWFDGRNFGILHRDETGLIRRCDYDQFGNKSNEIDRSAGKTWTAATDDYVVGRIETYNHTTDGVVRFGRYTYNDFGELAADELTSAATGTARTEYDRKDNGLLGMVTIIPHLTSSTNREITTYNYDVRGNLTDEARLDANPPSAATYHRYFSYSLPSSERLVRVEDKARVPFTPISDVRYSYDEWDNVRRIQATYTPTSSDDPVERDCWYDYDDAGRITTANGSLLSGAIGLKLHVPGSVRVSYDRVGRRSGTTEYVWQNHASNPAFFFTFDTMRDERYGYDDLGHLRRTEQRLRQVNIVRTNRATNESETRPPEVGDWQPLSTRSANLRGDVTRSEQWSRIYGAPNVQSSVDQVPAHLTATTSAYRADGQVDSTDSVADNPANSTRIQNAYDLATGLLSSYEFTGYRTDQTPYIATFNYDHTLQNGSWVVSRISDSFHRLNTTKTYDALGRLMVERVDLPAPDGDGTGADRYDERRYEYDANGAVVFKDTRMLPYPGSDGDLPDSSTGQVVYVSAGGRPVATVGADLLAEATKFDFAYTPMSEAPTAGATRYIVRSGDSLLDIAQTVYGDSALWYAVADANGVTTAPSDPLPTSEVGKAYEIPATIRSTNNASTFTPYPVALIMGNDRPIQIPPPPPPTYSVIDQILVTAAQITVQVGMSVGLSVLGVPAPISAAIGAGLGNLVGQELTWEMGMRAPGDDDRINLRDLEIATAEGYFFSVGGADKGTAGRVAGAVSRELWQQNKTGFEGWTNWRGITGSLANVGSEALRPQLGQPGFAQYKYFDEATRSFQTDNYFKWSVSGLINSALNPSSGWAIPGTERKAAVGIFEDAYGPLANGAASMGFSWIRQQLERPSAGPPVQGPRSVDEPRGALPAQLLDQWDEEDRLYTEEQDRIAQRRQNEQIAADGKRRLEQELQFSAMQDLIDNFGTDIDDRAIIRATLRRQGEERRQRWQAEVAAARERRLARQRAEVARLQAKSNEMIAEVLKGIQVTSENLQYLRAHALALQVDAQEAIINAEKAAQRAGESAETARRYGIALRVTKAVGGAFEATVGALACPTTGLGCVMAAHGVDTLISGVRGERSYTARLGTLITRSERGGDYFDALAGLALGFATSEATLINAAEKAALKPSALGIATKATPAGEAVLNVAVRDATAVDSTEVSIASGSRAGTATPPAGTLKPADTPNPAPGGASTSARAATPYYIPRDSSGMPVPLRTFTTRNGVDIPMPDPQASGPHTVLAGRIGGDGVLYRQSASFPSATWPRPEGLENIPWSRVDWHDHSRPIEHPVPHEHPFTYDFHARQWRAGPPQKTAFGVAGERIESRVQQPSPTPPSSPAGPSYYHQLNKGGLQDIMANQRLMSTPASSVAGGGEAVRASLGPLQQGVMAGEKPVIEFTTSVAPYNSGQPPYPGMWVKWPMPEGEYLHVDIFAIHYPPW
jgi:YD repeat-containing protein